MRGRGLGGGGGGGGQHLRVTRQPLTSPAALLLFCLSSFCLICHRHAAAVLRSSSSASSLRLSLPRSHFSLPLPAIPATFVLVIASPDLVRLERLPPGGEGGFLL